LLIGTLSVRENLAFSAALRLPMSMTSEERSEKVESVISELGLSHVANTKVSFSLCMCVHACMHAYHGQYFESVNVKTLCVEHATKDCFYVKGKLCELCILPHWLISSISSFA